MSSPSIILIIATFQLHEVQMFSSNVFCVNISLIYWQKIFWCQHFLKCNFRCHAKYYCSSFIYLLFLLSGSKSSNISVSLNTSKLKVWQSYPQFSSNILQYFRELKFFFLIWSAEHMTPNMYCFIFLFQILSTYFPFLQKKWCQNI